MELGKINFSESGNENNLVLSSGGESFRPYPQDERRIFVDLEIDEMLTGNIKMPVSGYRHKRGKKMNACTAMQAF